MKKITYACLWAPLLTMAPITAAETTATPPAPTSTATKEIPSPAMSIDALVADTVANNPELAYYIAEIDAAKGRQSVAGRLPDPQLGVQIGQRSLRSQGGGGGDGLSWSVSISQRFDFNGRNALRKAIAERQVERAEVGVEQFRRELAAKVTELGHGLLAAQERLDAADEVAARGRRMLAVLLQRDPAGVTPLLERRIIEAEVIKLEKRAAEERAKLLAALADLNLLRGLSPDSPLRLLPDTAEFVAPPSESELFAAALKDNFTLRQYEISFEEQGLNLRLETKEAFGDVTISPFYTEVNGGDRERTVGVGVTLPLPLWDRNAAPKAEAYLRRVQAETALQVTKRELRRDLAAALQDYRSSQELLAGRTRDESSKFRDSAEAADRHYRLGSVPVSTYLALQQAYLDVVDTMTSSRAEATKAASKLTALTGLPMRTFLRESKGGAK